MRRHVRSPTASLLLPRAYAPKSDRTGNQLPTDAQKLGGALGFASDYLAKPAERDSARLRRASAADGMADRKNSPRRSILSARRCRSSSNRSTTASASALACRLRRRPSPRPGKQRRAGLRCCADQGRRLDRADFARGAADRRPKRRDEQSQADPSQRGQRARCQLSGVVAGRSAGTIGSHRSPPRRDVAALVSIQTALADSKRTQRRSSGSASMRPILPPSNSNRPSVLKEPVRRPRQA